MKEFEVLHLFFFLSLWITVGLLEIVMLIPIFNGLAPRKGTKEAR